MGGRYLIALAPKRLNGYGGVGLGYALDKPYGCAYDLINARKIQMVFFYAAGGWGPAHKLSRNFVAHTTAKEVAGKMVNGIGLPPLADARSPLFDEAGNFEPGKQLHLS